MKNVFALIGIVGLLSCGADSYTSSKYFDPPQRDFKQDSDTHKLIYAFLEKALVLDKTKPVNSSIKDKKNIYINKTYYSNFSVPINVAPQEYQFAENDIPSIIEDVRFCLKSTSELQKIADNTSGFVYFTLGNIEINGDIAKIGINASWQNQTTTRLLGIGQGYIWQFKKVDGKWIFDKSLVDWIS